MIMQKPLSSICNMNMGQSPDSSSYNQDGDGLPFFQGNADFGELYPTVRYWCNSPTKIANKNDILISVRAPIGALNIATERCCIGRGLAALTARDGVSDTHYLLYALRSRVDELIGRGTGSTFKAISKKVLGDTLIPIPDIITQLRIAAALDQAQSLIAARREQVAVLDKLAKDLFIEMFGDLVKNDKGWEVKRLDEVAKSRLGKMLDAAKHTTGVKKKYLANFNVQWFRFDLSKLNEMFFPENELEEYSLKQGDLLICEGGEVGRCAIWNNELDDCYFQKALHRVRCNLDVVLPEYLGYWFLFTSEQTKFHGIATAATIAHLPGIKLKALQIPIPPIDLQTQYADRVAAINAQKARLISSLVELETLYESLTQRAFAGELFA